MTLPLDDPAVTPDRLRTVLAVARHENFTTAGAEVHLSQPAVSRQIAALEKSLGVRLFDRLGKAAHLTDAGRALLPEFRRIIGDIARLRETVRSVESGAHGLLRVGASATPGLYLIPRALAGFQHRCPEVELDYLVSNTTRVEEMVVENRVDIGFVGGAVSDPSLRVDRLATDEIVCFVSRRHRLARRKRVSPVDLARETLVMREEGSATGRIFRSWLLAGGGRITRTIELGCPEAVKTIVAAGLGVGCLSRFGLRDEFSRRELAVLQTSGARLSRTLSTIRHAKKHPSPSLRAFLEVVGAVSKPIRANE
jgi:DNA-binding transcriptional LysR family regulator